MSRIEDFASRLDVLEQKLRPIADRAVDVTESGWMEKLAQRRHPLDEAGVRPAAEALLVEIVEAYAAAAADDRRALRALFETNRAFAWATPPPLPADTEAGCRRHLLRFSLEDQGRDARDAILTLQSICRDAKGAGVEVARLLREVAELSSEVDRYGMGSTRDLLLRAC